MAETPTKIDLGPIRNFLTPETEDDETNAHDEQPKLEPDDVSRISKAEEAADDSEWIAIKDMFEGMKRDALPKSVPCPVHRENAPANRPGINSKYRQILIEWLLEVASEEKFRRQVYNIFQLNLHLKRVETHQLRNHRILTLINRTTLHLCISILDRYIFYCTNELPKAQLQTVGTSALFLAGKMEEVTPPILDRLVEFGDGAVDFDDLIKVVGGRSWKTSTRLSNYTGH